MFASTPTGNSTLPLYKGHPPHRIWPRHCLTGHHKWDEQFPHIRYEGSSSVKLGNYIWSLEEQLSPICSLKDELSVLQSPTLDPKLNRNVWIVVQHISHLPYLLAFISHPLLYFLLGTWEMTGTGQTKGSCHFGFLTAVSETELTILSLSHPSVCFRCFRTKWDPQAFGISGFQTQPSMLTTKEAIPGGILDIYLNRSS